MPNPIETSVVWGGLYKVNHTRWDDSTIGNDQIYRLAVPVLDKNEDLWMQDTHQIESHGLKDNSHTLAALDYIFRLNDPETGHWCIHKSIGRWYHKGNEKILNEDMLKDYELICDLHDYRPLNSNEDSRHYDSKDLIYNVKLYNEHGYSWNYGDIGVTLVRKDAVTNIYNKFLAALNDTKSDIQYPYVSNIHKNDMVKLYAQIENIHPKHKIEYENTLYLINKIKEVKNEINEYLDNHKYNTHYHFESSNLCLKDLHKDIKRYLECDCYCPYEIYSLDGFGYRLYKEDLPCQVIFDSDEYISCVCKNEDYEYPEILIFYKNGNKIKDALRIDVTENNLNIVRKRELQSDFDCYTGFETEESIQKLIDDFE